VIEALQELNGARVTELADRLELANSTVHSHLATLEQNRYVVREGDIYHLGLRFLNLGEYSRTRRPIFHESKVAVEKLAARTDERAFFTVDDHGRGIVVFRANGTNAVKVKPTIGQYVYHHNTSTGKAILAELPDERTHEIVDTWGLPKESTTTIVDREELFEELEDVREKGFAVTKGERIEGLRSIAAPVKSPDESVVGAFSVSGPDRRITDAWTDEDLGNLLIGAAKEVELNVSGR
jgi:DNA-binding IclR family transcriptional regulator